MGFQNRVLMRHGNFSQSNLNPRELWQNRDSYCLCPCFQNRLLFLRSRSIYLSNFTESHAIASPMRYSEQVAFFQGTQLTKIALRPAIAGL